MTSRSQHDRFASKIPEALAGLLGASQGDVEVRSDLSVGADFVISAVDHTFVIEFKMSTSAALVAAAVKKVRELAKQVQGRVLPILAVPFMGAVGRRTCDEAGVSWLDLSGNARIIAPGIRVIVSGQPNRFRTAGRPLNLFAPKSSRIVRWLLIHPDTPFSQREIARSTDMDEGFVSRLVSRLLREGYVIRDEDGAVRPKDPVLLLDAWHEAYRFSRHTLHKGHVSACSGEALLSFVCDILKSQHFKYAATGLAAAWVFTSFAGFRIATIYLSEDPPPAILHRLGLREDPRGANLWLVVPNDMGVFQGTAEKDGIRCVHPVQAYLDLKEHPERASEAAQRLRNEFLIRRRDG